MLVQKGYQLKSAAMIIEATDKDYDKYKSPLYGMTGDKYSFSSITVISVETAKKILAPSYLLYSDTKESDQIESARKITTH